MNKELIPCPFCGEIPIILIYTTFGKPDRYYIKHYCDNDTGTKVETVNFKTKKELIAAWNKRVNTGEEK